MSWSKRSSGEDNFTFAVGVIYIALVILGLIGWVFNLVQVIGLARDDVPLSAMIVIKALGIIAFPVGAVLGWLG